MRKTAVRSSTKPATRYVVVIDGKPGAYGMYVPDMPGCTSMGDTIADLLSNAQEALQLWAEDAVNSGESLPKPRSIDRLSFDSRATTAPPRHVFVMTTPTPCRMLRTGRCRRSAAP